MALRFLTCAKGVDDRAIHWGFKQRTQFGRKIMDFLLDILGLLGGWGTYLQSA